MTVNTAAVADAGDESGLVELRDADDVIRTRHRVRDLAARNGFDLVTQTKLVTAVSELARNAVQYGGGGRASFQLVQSPERVSRTGVVVRIEDDGPGIPDIERAMTGGWSSGSGLGLGLPGSQRLVHEFAIDSTPGQGTRVRIVMWRRGR